jgi:hypothetical protein
VKNGKWKVKSGKACPITVRWSGWKGLGEIIGNKNLVIRIKEQYAKTKQ